MATELPQSTMKGGRPGPRGPVVTWRVSGWPECEGPLAAQGLSNSTPRYPGSEDTHTGGHRAAP